MVAKFGVNHIGTIFFWLLVAGVGFLMYLIFKPFLNVIIISAILAALFYPLYEKLLNRLKKKENIAAFLATILVALTIVLPLGVFISYLTFESVEAYQAISHRWNDGFFDNIQQRLEYLEFPPAIQSVLDQLDVDLRSIVIQFARAIDTYVFQSAANLFKGALGILINFFFLILLMFFMFRDGKKWVSKMIYISPLFNKYDKQILEDLRVISVSAIGTTLIVAIVQGILSGIGFAIVGVPVLFLAVATAILSLIPLVGPPVIWIPTGIILLINGQIWQGIFIFLWGGLIVSTSDNVIRALLIKGRQKIHPLWIMFSVIGGVGAFGFLGIIYGPAILALAFTLLHIYELEYADRLKK